MTRHKAPSELIVPSKGVVDAINFNTGDDSSTGARTEDDQVIDLDEARDLRRMSLSDDHDRAAAVATCTAAKGPAWQKGCVQNTQ